MHPYCLIRVKENEISTIENLTHTMPTDCMPDTVSHLMTSQVTIYQYLHLKQSKMPVIKLLRNHNKYVSAGLCFHHNYVHQYINSTRDMYHSQLF